MDNAPSSSPEADGQEATLQLLRSVLSDLSAAASNLNTVHQRNECVVQLLRQELDMMYGFLRMAQRREASFELLRSVAVSVIGREEQMTSAFAAIQSQDVVVGRSFEGPSTDAVERMLAMRHLGSHSQAAASEDAPAVTCARGSSIASDGSHAGNPRDLSVLGAVHHDGSFAPNEPATQSACERSGSEMLSDEHENTGKRKRKPNDK
mmetsp:Transcript_431/g.864  ORF Transcript_431/g.864 Transcript_431/m.864 type:complete len:207 (-) Transcript_431:19-639(-)